MISPAFYARPAETIGRALGVGSERADREGAGLTSAARSAALVAAAGRALADDLRAVTGPLALSLNLGLPGEVPLLESANLDNYLYPLVRGLTAATHRSFVSVWAAKRRAPGSSVAVQQARTAPDPRGARAFEARTTASIITTEFREQIRRQAVAAGPLPDGGIVLQLAFVVGPRRAWPNLWKATIASLDPLLGPGDGVHRRNMRDGRVTELGLHCVVDPARGHDVLIAVRADPAAVAVPVPVRRPAPFRNDAVYPAPPAHAAHRAGGHR